MRIVLYISFVLVGFLLLDDHDLATRLAKYLEVEDCHG